MGKNNTFKAITLLQINSGMTCKKRCDKINTKALKNAQSNEKFAWEIQ